jgi:DMSO/TMAO reductase YedYZ heme-binding membrane subunit
MVYTLAGKDHEAVLLALQSTARLSFLFWLSTFIATPALSCGAQRLAILLKARRSALGFAFVGSHIVHLSLNVVLKLQYPDTVFPLFILVFGGLGVITMLALAVSSFPSVRLALGSGFSKLHSSGTWYLAAVFAYGLLLQPIMRQQLFTVLYLPFFVLMLAALGMRLFAALARSSRIDLQRVS